MANITRGSGSPTPGRYGSDLFFDPFRRMRELFELGKMGELGTERELSFSPSFEVKERPDSYLVRADLPGVKEQDLDIALTGDRLTVSGKREEEKRDDNERMHVYETSYGGFSRSFTLPDGIDVDHAQADLEDGVLRIVLPKSTKGQARKLQVGKGKAPQGGGQAKA